VVGAGDYSHDRFGQEDVHAVRVARSSGPVSPLGFCNRGGSEVWVYRGSRLRSPPVPVVLSVYQRGYLLDGLAMYLSCDTKKFHDNESTRILHNFWTSTHRVEAFPWRRHCSGRIGIVFLGIEGGIRDVL